MLFFDKDKILFVNYITVLSIIDNFEPENIITVDRKDNQSVFNPQNSTNLKDWITEYSIGELWNKNVIGGRP